MLVAIINIFKKQKENDPLTKKKTEIDFENVNREFQIKFTKLKDKIKNGKGEIKESLEDKLGIFADALKNRPNSVRIQPVYFFFCFLRFNC